MREDIKTGQAEMRTTIGAIAEKVEAAIHSIVSEVQETIQHRMENVMLEDNLQTESPRNELTKTEKGLQGVKASLDTQRDDLMETIKET
jgi:regulator of replication initiation timing